MSATMTRLDGYDHMAEVIERAVGPNDPYPTATQLAAHRAKQALQEKYFDHRATKEEAQ